MGRLFSIRTSPGAASEAQRPQASQATTQSSRCLIPGQEGLALHQEMMAERDGSRIGLVDKHPRNHHKRYTCRDRPREARCHSCESHRKCKPLRSRPIQGNPTDNLFHRRKPCERPYSSNTRRRRRFAVPPPFPRRSEDAPHAFPVHPHPLRENQRSARSPSGLETVHLLGGASPPTSFLGKSVTTRLSASTAIGVREASLRLARFVGPRYTRRYR